MLVPEVPVNSSLHRVQMEVTFTQVGAALFQRRDVIHDEEAAAVRRYDQIVCLLNNLDVINRDGWEVALELSPVAAVVARIQQAGIGAQNEESLAIGILANHARRIILG